MPRHAFVVALMALLMMPVAASPRIDAESETGSGPMTRRPSDALRPQSPRVARWLEEAQRRSATVRQLVDRILLSDVIVYLELSPAIGPHTAAALTWMADTPSRRIVRATFSGHLGTTAAIAMLAHELQHVVEVADHPAVRSAATLADLYRTIGHPVGLSGQRWDTMAAIAVEGRARSEASEPASGDTVDVRAGT